MTAERVKSTVMDDETSKEKLVNSTLPPERIFCVLLLTMGAVIGLLPQFAHNIAEVQIGFLLLTSLLGILLVYGAISIGINAKRADVFFDPHQNQFRIQRTGWFGAKTENEFISVADIRNFEILNSNDSDGDRQFQVALKNRLGQSIPLSGKYHHREDAIELKTKFEGFMPTCLKLDEQVSSETILQEAEVSNETI